MDSIDFWLTTAAVGGLIAELILRAILTENPASPIGRVLYIMLRLSNRLDRTKEK